MLAPLFAAKLLAPALGTPRVPRPALLARLAAPAPLTLVIAPAGFGKTTLLTSWLAEVQSAERSAQSAGQPVPDTLQRSAWLTLDERDNDPTRFWSGVIAALDATAPGVGDHARSMLQSPTAPPTEVIIGALIEELAALDGARVLVLDDYHLIGAEPVHAAVATLVDSLPPGLRLVIAGRAEPPLPLARWRLRGQLQELRAADLRFSAEEVSAMLALDGVTIPPPAVAALAARTEGWAGALALAALALRAGTDPQAQLASFAGAHRHLFDFLAEEVLGQQPPAIQRFLLDTSMLELLSAELCDAVREPAAAEPRSQPLLDEVERRGLFLQPLDDERRWYRYHTLFGEFLRERLRRVAPARVADLRRAAAAWYDARGMPAEAIDQLLAVDAPAAALIVEREGRALLLRSEVATVLGWLDALPPELLRERPALGLIAAWAHALAGQFEAVEAPLQAVEAQLAAFAGDPDAPTPFSAPYTPRNLASEAMAVRATVAGLRRETERAIALARSALAALPDDSVLVRGVVQLMLGTSAYLQGELDTAAPALEQAAYAGQHGGMPIIATYALRLLGELQARRGQLHRAARTYEEAIARGAELFPRRTGQAARPVPVAGAAYLGLAMLRYEWNELESAETLLRDALRLGRQGANAEIVLMAPIFLARVQRAQGDAPGARASVAEALAYARATGVPRLANWLAAEQARLELSLGDLAAAAAWDQARRLDPADQLSYLEEIDFLALAHLRVAQSRPAEALHLLTRLRGLAEAQGRAASLVEIHALSALAYRAAGDPAAAREALRRALALAAPEGFVRSFLDLGEPMQLALDDARRALAGQDAGLAGYVERLLATFPTHAGQPRATPVVAQRPLAPVQLPDPPTPRELEVLGWISEGLSNEEIAERLVVGLSTVKKHINNLYAKLEVASRTQALKRARELGLLD